MEDELANFAQINAQNFWNDAGNSLTNRGFPLCSGSKVIDVGGYLGDWTAYISRVHDCHVHVYEPVEEFCESMRARFFHNPKVKIFNFALEDRDARMPIAFMNDSSTFYSPPRQDATEVTMLDVAQIISEPIDLLALNCEGSEYAILERLIKSGKIKYIRQLLVQFHTFVDNAVFKREAIVEQLWKTHQQRWCYPFVWEAWSKLWKADD